MRIRSFGVLLVFLLFMLFVAVNWGSIMTPLPISFVLFSVNAPLGLFLVACGVALFTIMLLWMLWKQAITLLELQKANKEARSARALADEAEGSRAAKLEQTLDARYEAFEKKVCGDLRNILAEEKKASEEERKALMESLAALRDESAATVKALKRIEEETNQHLLL